MATESLEYKTLIGCIDKLTAAFRCSPLTVANELLSNGFISPEAHGKVLTSLLGDDVKAAQLVKCVTDLVSVCPGKYYDFMALSLFEEPWLNPLHQVLTTAYGMPA